MTDTPTPEAGADPGGFDKAQQAEIGRMAELMRRSMYSIGSNRGQTQAMVLTAAGNAIGRLVIETATSPEEVEHYGAIIKALIDVQAAYATGKAEGDTTEAIEVESVVRPTRLEQ